MTQEPVSLDELIAARDTLITIIVDDMPTAHREFLVGVKSGEPDWTLVGLPGIADLPSVRWKQQNLDQRARPTRPGGGRVARRLAVIRRRRNRDDHAGTSPS